MATTDITALIEQLHSPDALKRYEACEGLRTAADLSPDAIAALQFVAQDVVPQIADAARRAIAAHANSPALSVASPSPEPAVPAPTATAHPQKRKRGLLGTTGLASLIVYLVAGVLISLTQAGGIAQGFIYGCVNLFISLPFTLITVAICRRIKVLKSYDLFAGVLVGMGSIIAFGLLIAYNPAQSAPTTSVATGTSQRPPSTSAVSTGMSDGRLASAMLTSADIEQVVAGPWSDYKDSSNLAIPADLCQIDCSQHSWESPEQLLTIELIKLGSASAAEDQIQKEISASKSLSYEPQYLPRVDYLPDHTWLGILEDQKVAAYRLLMQNDVYYVRMWLF